MGTKELIGILRRNILQPVVIAIYTLAVVLLAVGERRDALFMIGVISFNTIFAIVQEVRARLALRKLELMNQPRARRQNSDGSFSEISFMDVVVGDTLQLTAGDEIPADAVVTDSHGLEVNESMLSGESQAVAKDKDSIVYSSTITVAGSAIVRVSAIGADTRAGQITTKLREYRPELTPLQKRINQLIFYMTFFSLGLIVLIAVVYWLYGYDIRTTLKTITSAGIAVIPEGLLLASTVLLAFGSLKLAQRQVLPQKLSAIEGMALLDVLCTDKTGTLTSDVIEFDRIEPLGASSPGVELLTGIAAYMIGGGNATSDAILSGLPHDNSAKQIEVLAFSSTRKLSGARFKYGKSNFSIIMGAPEFVARVAPLNNKQNEQLSEYTADGLRVLLVARLDARHSLKKLSDNSGEPIGFILLRNELRHGVKKTVAFFQRRGISLRVISGDNPETVRYVASSAGIENSDRVITGAGLAILHGKQFHQAVRDHTIFARVLPEQKEAIIKSFQRRRLYTGMVGDGVNDALSLKQSNLGVAMYDGASATRRVADIVLLNNSFNALPVGLRLGNRIMQAIEIVAVLSFHKIIMGTTILLVTMLVGLQYPFAPRHNTFMNIFSMTIPTIMWTLFPPLPRHRVNPKHFWKDTLFAVLPVGLVSGLAITMSYIITANYDLNQAEQNTVIVVITAILSISVVLQSGRIMGVKQTRTTRTALALYVIAAVIVASGSFGFGLMRNFFDFYYPRGHSLIQFWPLAIIVVAAIAAQVTLITRAQRKLIRRTDLSK